MQLLLVQPRNSVDINDVRAVIDSAKARGTDSLVAFIRAARPEATDSEVTETTERAVALIEQVPDLLERMASAAQGRELSSVVEPVLEHASRYFLAPIDVIPEMTQGLAGLLDDAYLMYRTLQHLEGGPGQLLGIDLNAPVEFLRSLVGERIALALDGAAVAALQAVSENVSRVWDAMARQA